jgi:hypothetical protein
MRYAQTHCLLVLHHHQTASDELLTVCHATFRGLQVFVVLIFGAQAPTTQLRTFAGRVFVLSARVSTTGRRGVSAWWNKTAMAVARGLLRTWLRFRT